MNLARSFTTSTKMGVWYLTPERVDLHRITRLGISKMSIVNSVPFYISFMINVITSPIIFKLYFFFVAPNLVVYFPHSLQIVGYQQYNKKSNRGNYCTWVYIFLYGGKLPT